MTSIMRPPPRRRSPVPPLTRPSASVRSAVLGRIGAGRPTRDSERRPVVTLTRVGLGLADPVLQDLVTHAKLLGQTPDLGFGSDSRYKRTAR